MAETETIQSRVFEALNKRASKGIVQIGTRELSEELDCSDITISSVLIWMKSHGWLDVVKKASPRVAMTYRIVPEEQRISKETNYSDLVTDGWSLQDIAGLIELWRAGCSGKEIGARLGRTKNAIIGRVHRLVARGVLEARVSPIIRSNEPKPPPASRIMPLPVLKSIAEVPMPIKLPLPQAGFGPSRWDLRASFPRQEIPQSKPRLVAGQGASLNAYGPHLGTPCQYILKDGSVTKPWGMCCVPCVAGRPYCRAHVSVAYIRVRDRPGDAA